MKRHHLLIGGLLAASLGCQAAQAANKPAKPKEQVAKARVSKAAKTLRQEARKTGVIQAGVVPTHVAPHGLALALSTDLSVLPAVAAVSLPAAIVPAAPAAPATYNAYLPYPGPVSAGSRENPYLPRQAAPAPVQAFAPIQAVPDFQAQENQRPGLGSLFGSLGQAIPILPDSGQSILPSIKKVYPTGEKPLVVVSFKCPTEVLGVTPPTIKLLHNLVDMGMDGLNKTDLLSFNLQQVCQ